MNTQFFSKLTFLLINLALVLITKAQVGINTETPQNTLHVNGSLQFTKELNVGGDKSTSGSAGNSGQLLVSNGANEAPMWKDIAEVRGTIASTHYVQGTTSATINEGQTLDVPGITFNIVVPSGKTQTVMFSILGFATLENKNASQGVFMLLQNNAKISSSFASKAGTFTSESGNDLWGMPIPVTFLKAVTLTAGTYSFKVQYKSWKGSAKVNHVPSGYLGYDGDVESMLTKMQILVYNN